MTPHLWTPKPVKGWEIFLPPPTNKRKKWLSLNDRNHWSRSSPLTRYWRTLAFEQASLLEVRDLPEAYAVACFSFGDKRRRDVHNYMPTVKAAIDGCTDAGLWVDDRDGILTGPDVRRVEVDGQIGLSLHIFEVISNA